MCVCVCVCVRACVIKPNAHGSEKHVFLKQNHVEVDIVFHVHYQKTSNIVSQLFTET